MTCNPTQHEAMRPAQIEVMSDVTTAEFSRQLLTVPEAASRIGMSERWMWQQVLARSLPVVCLGRRRLIRPGDLDVFVDERVEGQR